MALITLNFYSEALGMQTQAMVILPQKTAAGEIGIRSKAKDNAYKCLYLLHGLSDDHTIWMRRTSIERYAAEYGICVVMPAAGRSFYTDMAHGQKYYTYIAQELPMRIQEFFRVSDKQEDNFIAGLSMGGYGALKIALREHDKFCACGALSPVCDMDTLHALGEPEMMIDLYGQLTTPDLDSLQFLADREKDSPVKPRIYMATGTQDFLYNNAQPLRKQLTDNGYDFTYVEAAAGHNWEYWDEQIQKVLKWMFDKG